MKRRSMEKHKKTKGTYSRKMQSPDSMMYGPTRHTDTHSSPTAGQPRKGKSSRS